MFESYYLDLGAKILTAMLAVGIIILCGAMVWVTRVFAKYTSQDDPKP